ncbi:MAG: h, partial [Planctomycetaceae bacterium]|nr:h [Planctomycetaceae bacterium]
RFAVVFAVATTFALSVMLNFMVPAASAEDAGLPNTKSPQIAANSPKSKTDNEIAGILPAPLPTRDVSDRIDSLIDADLKAAKLTPAARTTDEDFLRRVTFDLAGTTPEPNVVSLFGLDPDMAKRSKTIDRLLESADYARNWSQYWREVLYSRATDPRSRISQKQFEAWMVQNFTENRGWNKIATDMLTATGDVQESGATALFFAHQGDPEEVASEASRIFLGIQIQCANCHDHPTDKWKREQFHELAAFFPRVALRRDQNAGPLSFRVVSMDAGPGGGRFAEPGAIAREPEKFIQQIDRNNDHKITLDEVRNDQFRRVFTLLMERADANKDGALTAAELKAMPIPEQQGRGSLEHYMPNLEDPGDRGRKMDPAFFVSNVKANAGMKDVERRELAAKLFTSNSNEWFAKAFVNRIWSEMLGEGFFMPIDDIGPERKPNSPEVLNLLSRQFAAHDYDIKWLFRTIANTHAYQRSVRAKLPTETAPTFAAAVPTRLRSDQLYDALTSVLGISDLGGNRPPQRGAGAGQRVDNSPRGQFNALFGFDPSTPQDEITGTVPQVLFFMNSPLLQSLTRGTGQTRLARILQDFSNDDDALTELYLLVLSRQPSDKELKICRKFLSSAPNRREGYEDLMWSLLNSSEFLTKR